MFKTLRKKSFIITLGTTLLCSTLLGCSSGTQTVGSYIDDTVITTKVKAALLEAKDLNSTEISVQTFNGEVQLSGFVSSAEMQKKAAMAARQVKGVKKVINDTELKKIKN